MRRYLCVPMGENTECADFIDPRWYHWFRIYNSVPVNNRILSIAFNGILALSTIFLNLLSVLTIRKSSQLKNKLCYFVIQIQSFVDLVVGLFSVPAFIVILALPLLNIQNCLCHALLLNCLFFPSVLSIATLSAMTMEGTSEFCIHILTQDSSQNVAW